jgi:hypothetical protein
MGDIVATNAKTGTVKRRYRANAAVADDRGAVTEGPMWAGQGVDAIRDIPSAGEVVERLWRECVEAV